MEDNEPISNSIRLFFFFFEFKYSGRVSIVYFTFSYTNLGNYLVTKPCHYLSRDGSSGLIGLVVVDCAFPLRINMLLVERSASYKSRNDRTTAKFLSFFSLSLSLSLFSILLLDVARHVCL